MSKDIFPKGIAIRLRLVGRTASFQRLLSQATSRMEIVVTLLAVLEMIKQIRITIRQDRLFGDVLISRLEPPGPPAS